MFEASLKSKLSQIFGFRKTTYDAPSVDSSTGTYEQQVLFIDITQATTRACNGKAYCHVRGSMTVFAQMNKLPFGYFNKRIEQADPELTKDLFFYDIDLNPASSPARIQNIAERRVSFIYLYSTEYDPDQGEMTSLEF